MRSTVFCDHAPPRGGSMPCSVSAAAMAREDWPAIDTSTGRKASSRAAASAACFAASAGIAQLYAAGLGGLKACASALADHAALLLGERGVDVQRERDRRYGRARRR